MRVLLLGPLQVLDGRSTIGLGGRLNRALVARLAIDAGRPVRSELLIEDLWGDDRPQDPTNALQSIISRTRRRLPDGTLLSTPAGYVLQAQVDVTEFRDFLAQGRSDRALELWRSDPLADLAEMPFALELAGELASEHLTALEQDLADRAPTAEVIAQLSALVRDHPYREGFWLLYLRALATSGRKTEAIAAYGELRHRLAQDLGTDPSPALRDLHTRLLREQLSTARSTGGRTLPTPWTSFVGRDAAVRDVLTALDEHRLVTLVGPGGAGKSRLAIESAGTESERFRTVRLVELAPIREDSLVAAVRAVVGPAGSVLDRWGSRSAPGHGSRQYDAFSDLDGLLILDNCEHIIDPVAALVEKILMLSPRVRVLATGREALRITGECVYPVPALEIPDESLSAQRAGDVGAVRLFVERARGTDRSFVLDTESLPAVREICRRLDGQPLAIELAAARLRTLTVQEISARLSDRFALLTQGSRTAPARHRTLRDVVEWSWDLLDPSERDLVERIAVFPGGVTAAGASAVLPGDTRVAAVEAMLDSLAEKSLLVPVRGSRRFRMLETLREYGIEQLTARGAYQQVLVAFRHFYLDMAEELAMWIPDGRQVDAIRTIHIERDNLVAALEESIADGDRNGAARMLASLIWFWSIRDEHAELDRWVMTVLEMDGPLEPSQEILCTATALAGIFALPRPNRQSEPLIERILELWDTHHPDDPFTALVMATLQYFGLLCERPLPETPHPWSRRMIQLMHLLMAENTGRLDAAAMEDLDEVLDGARTSGDRWALAVCLGLRGTLHGYEGRFVQALTDWKEAEELLIDLDAQSDLTLSRIRIDILRIAAADQDDLPALHEEFTRALHRTEDRKEQTMLHLSCGILAHVRGDDRTALSHLHTFENLAEDFLVFAQGHLRVMVLALTAGVEARCGKWQAARARLGLCARLLRPLRDLPLTAFVGTVTAVLTQLSGDDRAAARILGATVALRGQEDLSDHDARTLARDLRQTLGTQTFESLHDQGRRLSRNEALDLVLSQDFLR